MKYSFRFNKKININKADEIILRYERNSAQNLVNFFCEHPNKTFILQIDNISTFIELSELKDLEVIYELYPVFSLCFTLENPKSIPTTLQDIQIPYFFHNPVSDWDTLLYYIQAKVSQIYITEALGFELNKVANLCHNAHISIRAYPNVLQNCISNSNPLHCFFIRPEDVLSLEKYIDVLEFWGPDNKQEICYDIYNKHQWLGDLKDLILGCRSSIDNTKIMPIWGETRAQCNRRCLKDNGCNICKRMLKKEEQA